MKYYKADLVLPDSLVRELQRYVQGGYLYIPSQKDGRRKWGELSGSRAELNERNARIRQDYADGSSVDELAEAYYLSVHSIRKIAVSYTHLAGREPIAGYPAPASP